ncbi:MAG: hypothetical protein Kow0026_00220 [Oricola sp.]
MARPAPRETPRLHSLEKDPDGAIKEALAAWRARRAVRSQWHVVEKVTSDLLVGRRRFDVTLEDAHNSPLCTVGIEAFLKRVGMAGRTRISGRAAAILMKLVEPQMGFVIHQAFLRVEAERPVVAPIY